jgi:hypothetical protein
MKEGMGAGWEMEGWDEIGIGICWLGVEEIGEIMRVMSTMN